MPAFSDGILSIDENFVMIKKQKVIFLSLLSSSYQNELYDSWQYSYYSPFYTEWQV